MLLSIMFEMARVNGVALRMSMSAGLTDCESKNYRDDKAGLRR